MRILIAATAAALTLTTCAPADSADPNLTGSPSAATGHPTTKAKPDDQGQEGHHRRAGRVSAELW
jgi:hypothetical protein